MPEGFRAEPKSDATPIFQRCIILSPVVNVVLVLRLGGVCILLHSHVEPHLFVLLKKVYRFGTAKARTTLSAAIYATKPWRSY